MEDGDGSIAWRPEGEGHVVVLSGEDDLTLLLLTSPALSRVALLWPRVSETVALARLAHGGDWRTAAETCARLSQQGSRIEVEEIPSPTAA